MTFIKELRTYIEEKKIRQAAKVVGGVTKKKARSAITSYSIKQLKAAIARKRAKNRKKSRKYRKKR